MQGTGQQAQSREVKDGTWKRDQEARGLQGLCWEGGGRARSSHSVVLDTQGAGGWGWGANVNQTPSVVPAPFDTEKSGLPEPLSAGVAGL